jgi:hypothetical protein
MIEFSIDNMKKIIPTILGDNADIYKDEFDDSSETIKDEIIGDSLFESISEDLTLLKKTERVIYLKTFLNRIPELDLVLTDAGFAVVGNKNYSPASRQRVDKLIEQIEKKYDNSIEKLYTYLEKTEKHHEKWKDSPAYSILSDVFIHTLNELKRHVSFSGSRAEFKMLRASMINYQKIYLEKIISTEYCEYLLKGKDLDDNDTEVLELCKFATANYVTTNTIEAEIYQARIKGLLNKADNYPIYKESELYAKLQVKPSVNLDKSVIGFG